MTFRLILSLFLMGIIFPGNAQLLKSIKDQQTYKLEKLQFKQPIKSKSNQMIIISCSGKSGSTTLEASFKALGFESHRFHKLEEDMYNYISGAKKDKVILFIDSMRDVISRKVASYFHHLSYNLHADRDTIRDMYKNNRKKLFKKIQNQLDDQILKIAHFHAFSDWKKFDYDCLNDEVFDHEKKYQLKKIGHLYFVNLRFDDIGEWQKIIRSLDVPINLKKFKVVSANKSADKWYAEIYKDFLPLFKISKENFDIIVNNFAEEIAHFYTKEEIEAFIAKWKPHITK